MKTKSVNHLTISARLTSDAAYKGENQNVVRFAAVHHVGDQPLFLNCVMFANKGKKNERVIPMERLTKGNTLVLEGFLKPTSWEKDGKKRTGYDFVVTAISEPEVIADSEDAASEEETEGEAAEAGAEA
jgi:single-stranded DNA-binding protein